MRAEMLRLTKELRKMVAEGWAPDDLAREAENLIHTEVEPHVRELSSRIKSDVKLTGLGHTGQLFKSIGLLGFGCLTKDEDMQKQAVTDGLEHLGNMIPVLPRRRAETPASRFVIEIQQGIRKMA